MSKKIISVIKLKLQAGKATPAAPVGPVLGQQGINISAFCKEYNALTLNQIGTIVPVQIFIYEDKSYKFFIKTTPTSLLLKNAINITKGSSTPNEKNTGIITKDQLKQIAVLKLNDLNTTNIDTAIKIIEGTAQSLGISIQDKKN
uniref:Large ribosomal subunit protein uL11m n=1 Tax=Nitzschia sp. NIES-3576 TaxID=2083273 RepID=A0A2Z5ZB79_9STRA|nr:ribosomal protein L11 [Nitzschia sp. NIES-3576]